MIEEVHREYYEAGANISITASYQANVKLFIQEFNFEIWQGYQMIIKSVELAQDARDKNRKDMF